MTNSDHPCSGGLTPSCFAAYPLWAKQMFSWRLLTTLTPPALSRRLQKMHGIKPFFPGVEIPPGVVLPPGTVVPPGVVVPPDWQSTDRLPPGVWYPAISWEFPPGWVYGDPPPPGVEFDPATIWPPGWKLGDPLPDGVTLPDGFYYPPFIVPNNTLPDGTYVPPGTVFPSDWTYGDPLPDGVILPPGFDYDPAWTPDISLPYNFTIEPGSVFPADWTYGQPLPSGVFGPSYSVYGQTISGGPPVNFDPFPPGPPSAPGRISPPSGGWAACFDDSYWIGYHLPDSHDSYYDDEATPPHWSSYDEETALHILPTGTWHHGFRPSQVRFTNDQPMYATMIFLYDTASNEIASYNGIESPKTLDCDFSNNLNIKSIWATILGHDISVRLWNIEFFS